MGKALTESEKVFVREYAADRNGTKAYLQAYPESGYASARTRASRLLQKSTIRAELDSLRRANLRDSKVSAERTLRDLAIIAHQDPDDVFMAGPSGEPVLRPWDSICPLARRTIKKIRFRRRLVRGKGDDAGKLYETEEVEVAFHSSLEALEKLGQYLGLFKNGAALDGLLAMLKAGEQPPALDPDPDPAPLPSSPGSAAGHDRERDAGPRPTGIQALNHATAGGP